MVLPLGLGPDHKLLVLLLLTGLLSLLLDLHLITVPDLQHHQHHHEQREIAESPLIMLTSSLFRIRVKNMICLKTRKIGRNKGNWIMYFVRIRFRESGSSLHCILMNMFMLWAKK